MILGWWRRFLCCRLLKNIIRFVFVSLFAKLAITLGKVLIILASVWCSVIALTLVPEEEMSALETPG
jgi:hypothetical protein